MNNNLIKQHWENIYQTKNTSTEVSWYQNIPKTSIDLILSTKIDKNDNIIDVGGGDSRLIDNLLELGFHNLFVLDISAKALQKAQARLGKKAKAVTWLETNILEFETNLRFNLWHDRATFHFLTKTEEIVRYLQIAGQLIKPHGHLVISTFSENGPKKCSRLDIKQYSKTLIIKTFEKDFNCLKNFEETHQTPFGTKQNFLFSVFKRK